MLLINIKISARILILLETLSIYESTIDGTIGLMKDYIKQNSDKSILFANPFILKYAKQCNLCNDYYEYFNPIDFERVQYIHSLSTSNESYFCKSKNTLSNKPLFYYNDKRKVINVMGFKGLVYNRYFKVGSHYVENTCKILFEYLYLGKEVYYSPINKTIDDGLTEYLKLFGIDDNIEQIISINKKPLNQTLGFTNNLILSTL